MTQISYVVQSVTVFPDGSRTRTFSEPVDTIMKANEVRKTMYKPGRGSLRILVAR